MKFKLTVYPALEVTDLWTTFKFETLKEMEAAVYGMSMLLIFIQDKAKLMDDYSNVFIREEFHDGEWVAVED